MPEPIDPVTIFFAVWGFSTLIILVWSWRGKTHRSRWWTRRTQGDGVLLVCFPIFATLLPLFVLTTWGIIPREYFRWLVWIPIGITAWAFVVSVLGLIWWPLQKLWGPRWYTHQSEKQMWDAINDPLGNVLRAANAAPSRTRKRRWLGKDTAMWHVRRIVDPEHPVRQGAITGVLRTATGGIWFDAPGSPEPIRTESATATRWEHVLDARAVGDADDIHGNRVSTFWTRSWLTRLVIETTDGPQMYEVTSWRAKHAAHTITTERRASHAR